MKQIFSSKFKEKQDKYFRVNQPHLRASLDNYTLKIAKRLAFQASLNSHDQILEIGCGSGRFTQPLLTINKDLKITGLDFSAKLITELRDLKLKNLKTILGDLDQVNKLTKEKYNKIIGFYILHHLPDLETSLRSLKRVASKNSQLAFVEPNPLNWMYYPQPFLSKNMSWQEEKGFIKLRSKFLKEAFRKSGYKEIDIVNFGFFPPFIVNRSWGKRADDFLEKLPLKSFLPFQLITARVK